MVGGNQFPTCIMVALSFIMLGSGEPFSGSSYIYGRYKLSGSTALYEDFFPILHANNRSALTRTPWLAKYLRLDSRTERKRLC